MALMIQTLDSTLEKTWDDLILSSPHGTLFHTIRWLRIVQNHLDVEFHPLVFFKGKQLVAVCPIFISNKGPIKIALSPPSRSYMIYLGPVLADYTSLKMDKKERNYLQVQEELDNYIFNKNRCKYARIRTSPGLFDSRPLLWTGYNVDPAYTYRIDVTKGLENIWGQFEGKLRVKIKKSIKEGVTVRLGDKGDLEFIHNLLNQRYLQQGYKPNDYKKYISEIFQQFYPENLKIFIAEYKGNRVSGALFLCWKQGLYLWVGVPKTELSGISPNDVINWEAIKWASAKKIQYYEEMDSGEDPRLTHFKSKYNPDLVIWYSAEKYSSPLYKAGDTISRILKR